jgi:hypothetical protein
MNDLVLLTILAIVGTISAILLIIRLKRSKAARSLVQDQLKELAAKDMGLSEVLGHLDRLS